MLQKIEEISPTTRKLIINVPSDVIQSESDIAYNELKTNTRIPGFRPGKVPQAILVKRFGKNVEAQIIEKIVPQYYLQAIQEAKLEPVSYPNIDEKIEIKPGQPLSFSVTVEIKPDIGNINYDGISLEEKADSVTDDDIEKAIKSLQESKALYTVSEDELKEGDMAIIDSDAFIDNQLVEEITYKEYPFVLGSIEMPKEVSDVLTGKKKGESCEVKITYEKTHPNRTIAGKEVVFKMVITETKKKNIPPLDDDFAKDSDYENMEDLRNGMKENISKRKKDQINLEYKKEILNELIKRHDFAVPDSMVQGEIESLVNQAKQNAAAKNEALKPDEELKKENESTAKDNIKGVLILEAIGKNENIEVSDDDIKLAINEIAERNALKPEEVKKLYSIREGSMEALKSRLFADKVLEFILEKSTMQKS